VSVTFENVRVLVGKDDWRASDHALQRLAESAIIVSDLADGILSAVVIEDYPSYHAGPCTLVLQSERNGPVHALWGLQDKTDRPAVLITAYRPDPAKCHADNRTRK
jgi:Domain of unknown function (DUF4258)